MAVTPLRHDEGMTNSASSQPTDLALVDPAQAEQLSLLPLAARDDLKPRFRLGKATRERGLRHVAEIKEQLARRQRERETAEIHQMPARHRHAA